MKSKVSIIIPVYNSIEFLVESLDSIVTQTYENMTIMIVDDCSTDDSYNILKSYETKYPKIKLFKNETNIGVAKSLNFLLHQVGDSDYIARHDADDVSLPDRINKLAYFLDTHKDIDLVGSWYIHIDQVHDKKEWFYTKPVNDIEIKKFHFSTNAFVHGSVMFRKKILESVGYYDDKCGLWEPEDYDYWTRIMRKHKVANIPEYLYKWRCYPDNRCGLAGKGCGMGHKVSQYKIWCETMGIEFNREDVTI